MEIKYEDENKSNQKRIRKTVQRLSQIFDQEFSDRSKRKVPLPVGNGVRLGEIERVKDAFNRLKIDKEMAKNIHMLCYTTPGQALKCNNDIKKFNGFKNNDAAEIKKRHGICDRMTLDALRIICDLFNIHTWNKHKIDVSTSLIQFLQCPVETGSIIFGTNALKPKKESFLLKPSKNTIQVKSEWNHMDYDSEIDIGKAVNIENVTAASKTSVKEEKKVNKTMEKKDNKSDRVSTFKKKSIENLKEINTNISNIPGDISYMDYDSEIDIGEAVNIVKTTVKSRKSVKNEKKIVKKSNRENIEDLKEVNTNITDLCDNIPDSVFINFIRDIISTSDDNTTTLNQVCNSVVDKFPGVDLISKRQHIKLLIKNVIRGNY